MAVFKPAPDGSAYGTSMAQTMADMLPPGVRVPTGGDPPVHAISGRELQNLGQKMTFLWQQYRSDRRIAELRWLRNERQYLGIYDPEIDKELQPNRSRAYPRITRIKCISVLSRIMNLLFPGDERNWSVTASPNANIPLKDVQKAIQDAMKLDQEAGMQPELTEDYVIAAVQTLADKQAEKISDIIDGQLAELGGDQTLDYVHLNRKVLQSGILYGLGCLKGPHAVAETKTVWSLDKNGQPVPKTKTIYKPIFEFMKIWDFYPDMSAKTLVGQDGYFERMVMSRSQVLALCDREDFFCDQIKEYLANHQIGNYRPLEFETELRTMGVKVNVNELKTESTKFELIVWHGKLPGNYLVLAGVDVPEGKMAEELDAELWMIDGNVICCKLNPWVELGVDVKTLHYFLFDEDDTSPIGFGLPNAVRDSQMSVSAATRMMMDNASVVCGPQLEINTDLLRPDQDLASTSAYKIWYRTGEGPDAQWPAVRPITVDAHLPELMQIVELFLKFADAETFVGPMTGGDMAEAPSEPMRTMGGASMIRGEAALPFKDIVRSFDCFVQSVILSIVQFNRKFNPSLCPDGDYDVIARGATSMIAKELRGMQIDQISLNMTDDEKDHVNTRKLVDQKFRVRDLGDLLLPEDEAARNKASRESAQAQVQQSQQELVEANIRKLLSDAFKNIALGQKNAAGASALQVETALQVLEAGVMNAVSGGSANGAGSNPATSPSQGQPGNAGPSQPLGLPEPDQQGQAGGMPTQEVQILQGKVKAYNELMKDIIKGVPDLIKS